MPDIDCSGRLGLPFILPSQSQKHVTYNEALQILDAIVQLAVVTFNAETPPLAPQEGEIHALGAAPTNEWFGHAGSLAYWTGAGWIFVTPSEGWLAADIADGGLRQYRDGAWHPLLENISGLGIGTLPDAVNRLAVASDATLFSHAGTDHRLKVNKAATNNTASLLFQTGWSGRAEMGLAGDDAFSVKVSADGLAWQTALTAHGSSGRVELPAGARLGNGSAGVPSLAAQADSDTGQWFPAADCMAWSTGGVERLRLGADGLLSGQAVQSSGSDVATAGKLVRTDGATAAVLSSFGSYYASAAGRNIDTETAGGVGLYNTSNPGTWPPGAPSFLWVSTQRLFSSNAAIQQAVGYVGSGMPPTSGTARWFRIRANDGTWGEWRRVYDSGNVLGTVSQSGGMPTGGLIESGSNASGSYVRFASGMQICRHTLTGATGAGSGWTFPAAFSAAPAVNGTAVATVLSAVCLDAAPSATAATVSARGADNARRADTMHLTATGRWF